VLASTINCTQKAFGWIVDSKTGSTESLFVISVVQLSSTATAWQAASVVSKLCYFVLNFSIRFDTLSSAERENEEKSN